VVIHRTKIVDESADSLTLAKLWPLQKILLSATLSHNPEQLMQLNLYNPKYLTISGENASKSIFSVIIDFNTLLSRIFSVSFPQRNYRTGHSGEFGPILH